MATKERMEKTMFSFTDAIKSELNCICCKGLLWPPIRHCENGHAFCITCYRTCTKDGCSRCGKSCRHDRTHHLEKLFDILTFPCGYNLDGCKEELSHSALLAHELNCPIRREQLRKMTEFKLSP